MAKALGWSDIDLLKTLGEGQAGKVWLAKLKIGFRDLPKDSLVAVKVYKPWLLEESGQFERIFRELEVGRKFNHPKLVQTLSMLRDDHGNPALVMSYYPGETLEQYLQRLRDNSLSVNIETAFQILTDLIDALKFLHQRGVIHRDVKPSNIILHNEHAILMDLGVVRSQDFPEQTTTGAFLGTIRYAAPEYLFGDAYDYRADVYSLGAVAYELFVGEKFLNKAQQWARLIVEKSTLVSKKLGGINSHLLHQRFGLEGTQFIYFALNQMLVSNPEDRIVDLDNIFDALQHRLWGGAFFTRNGTILPGEPSIDPIKGWSQDTICYPRNLAELLRRELSSDQIDLLHRLLQEIYYSGEITGVPIKGVERAEIDNSLKRFLELGVFEEHTTGYAGELVYFTIHYSVRMAYRYGHI